ncbi:hypothetical protein [Flavobacterium sp.]|uniref:toxin-antitoxin system YwqK family antitoxin n=1 Tax=Flavobacterium sp. TaxID=239 RepID=UPI00262976A6|nr:hypothetical protein [Flavobacterium sp.]MDD2987159.1 hypothetical protein [Flavobacterium sp.]
MKVKYFALFVVLFLTAMLSSFKDPIQKKKITDVNFRYEFFTSSKKTNIQQGRIYYWFKAGAIHTTENGSAGELLHSGFEKFYLDNQLAEKGSFSYGQKEGSWRTWHKNGLLDTKQYWQDGRKHGAFFSYNTNGVLVEKGSFKKGNKNGRWINFIKKDTILYKNGVVYIKKVKLTKEEKKAAKEVKLKLKEEQQLERKNNKEASKKARELKKENKFQEKINNQSTKKDNSKKENFFKRLFAKKEKKPNA